MPTAHSVPSMELALPIITELGIVGKRRPYEVIKYPDV